MSKHIILIALVLPSLIVITSGRHDSRDLEYNDPNEVMLDTRRRHSRSRKHHHDELIDNDQNEVMPDTRRQSKSRHYQEEEPIDNALNEAEETRRKHSGKNKHKKDLRVKNDYEYAYTSGLALRIRGGNVSDTLNFPYMAAIILGGRLWCAGAIVDINWVLTAAHCLNYVLNVSPMKTLGKFVKVRVGSVRAHEGGVLVEVAGAVRHPKFEEEPVPHADIALLKLVGNLEFGPTVNLIQIYDGMKEPYAQSFIVTSGWGVTKGTESAFRDPTPDLLYGRLKVRTRHFCQDAYQLVNGFQFTEDFFCASLRNGTRDACLVFIGTLKCAKLPCRIKGLLPLYIISSDEATHIIMIELHKFDAGAPAVQNNRLMGILSFGPERCGHEYQPAVFIKAFYFKDFVADTIHKYKSPLDIINAMQEADPSLKGAIESGGLTKLGLGGDIRDYANTSPAVAVNRPLRGGTDEEENDAKKYTNPDEKHN